MTLHPRRRRCAPEPPRGRGTRYLILAASTTRQMHAATPQTQDGLPNLPPLRDVIERAAAHEGRSLV
jgi:hypothetical protein